MEKYWSKVFYKNLLISILSVFIVNILIYRSLMMSPGVLAIILFFGLVFVIAGNIFTNRDYGNKITYYFFWGTFFFHVIAVVFYYYYFILFHGEPFLLLDSDEMGYNGYGMMLAEHLRNGEFDLLNYFPADFSDFGYPFFLSIVYTLFGNSLIIARIIQAIISAFSVVLVYKISKNYFTEEISKLAATFMMLSPIFTLFCAIQLKETIFVFLVLFAVYYVILLLKSSKFIFSKLLIVILSILSLFAFRPAVGLSMIVSFLFYYLYRKEGINKSYRIVGSLFFTFIFIFLLLKMPVMKNIQEMFNRSTDYSMSVVSGSNSRTLMNIAGIPIFALIGIIGPPPNLLNFNIDSEQLLTIQLFSIDAILKGILAFFVVDGMIYVFVNGLRKVIFIVTVFFTNFLVITMAGVSFNFRYQLIILPFFFIFASIGIFNMNKSKYTFFIFYIIAYIIFTVVFNYTKMTDIGMLLT